MPTSLSLIDSSPALTPGVARRIMTKRRRFIRAEAMRVGRRHVPPRVRA